jgi:hypothetical protein
MSTTEHPDKSDPRKKYRVDRECYGKTFTHGTDSVVHNVEPKESLPMSDRASPDERSLEGSGMSEIEIIV